MATIGRFQDLEIWKQSKSMAVLSYKYFHKRTDKYDNLLISQLLRSAVSVSSNIAEGFEREGRKEFIQFLAVAKGSNGEFLTQLIIAHEIELIDDQNFNIISKLSLQTGLMIRKLMQYLSTSSISGKKYSNGVEEPETAYLHHLFTVENLNEILTSWE